MKKKTHHSNNARLEVGPRAVNCREPGGTRSGDLPRDAGGRLRIRNAALESLLIVSAIVCWNRVY